MTAWVMSVCSAHQMKFGSWLGGWESVLIIMVKPLSWAYFTAMGPTFCEGVW